MTLEPTDVGYKGLHTLDDKGNYLGPLPKHCPHGPHAHKPLVGKDEQGRWMTAPSAAYPPELLQVDCLYCMACPATPAGGGDKGSP